MVDVDSYKPQYREFVTKDSGVREVYATGMKRDTEAGKARLDLAFPIGVPYEEQLLVRLGYLLARGAEKYGERNWESGYDAKALARARSSALRHLVQWLTGQTDEDHAAAVIFNLMQAEYLKRLGEQGAVVREGRSMVRSATGLNNLAAGAKVEVYDIATGDWVVLRKLGHLWVDDRDGSSIEPARVITKYGKAEVVR